MHNPMREAFEVWLKSEGWRNLERYNYDDSYEREELNDMWSAWQAASATAPEVSASFQTWAKANRYEISPGHFNKAAEDGWNACAATATAGWMHSPTEEMCDGARQFLLGMEIGIKDYAGIKDHFNRGGFVIPKWLSERKGHLTKWDKADCIWRLMAETLNPQTEETPL